MKRILMMIFAIVMVLCMAGCGEKKLTASEELIQLYEKYGFDEGSEYAKISDELWIQYERKCLDVSREEKKKLYIDYVSTIVPRFSKITKELRECNVQKENNYFKDLLLKRRECKDSITKINLSNATGQLSKEETERQRNAAMQDLYRIEYAILRKYYQAKGYMDVPSIGFTKQKIRYRGYLNKGDFIVAPIYELYFSRKIKGLFDDVLPNGKFAIMTVGVLNSGQKPISVFPSYFKLVDNKGLEYLPDEETMIQFKSEIIKKNDFTIVINPGTTALYSLVFDVPVEKVESEFKLSVEVSGKSSAVVTPVHAQEIMK